MSVAKFCIYLLYSASVLIQVYGYVAYIELELLSFRVLDRDTIGEGSKCDDDHVNGAWNLCDFVFYVRNCSRLISTYDCTTRIDRFYAPENTDYVIFDYPRPATGVTIEGAPKEMVFNITVYDQDDGRSADDFIGNYLLRVTPDLIFRQDSRLVGMTEQLITIPRHSEMKLRWRAYCGDTECRNYQGFSPTTGQEIALGQNRNTGSSAAFINQINFRGEQISPQTLNQFGGPQTLNQFGGPQTLSQFGGPQIDPNRFQPSISVNPGIGPIQQPFPVPSLNVGSERALVPPIQQIPPPPPPPPLQPQPGFPPAEPRLFPRETVSKAEQETKTEEPFVPVNWRNTGNDIKQPAAGEVKQPNADTHFEEPSSQNKEPKFGAGPSAQEPSQPKDVNQNWSNLQPERLEAKPLLNAEREGKLSESESNKEPQKWSSLEPGKTIVASESATEHNTKWSNLTPERIDATYKTTYANK